MTKSALNKLREANKETFALALYKGGRDLATIAQLVGWTPNKTKRVLNPSMSKKRKD